MATEHKKGQMSEGGSADMSGMMQSSVHESPVDDRTYNLLQALTSKLEAIEAYEIYEQDDDGQLFSELIQEERRHAERLLQELRRVLAE
jgi:uncharacterized protein (UPF0276 family)